MLGANVTLTKTDKSKEIEKLLEDLRHQEVFVGIPEANAPRAGDELSNAQILFLNTHGVRSSSMREEMQPELDKGSPYSAAHMLYITSHGSAMWRVPPRPVLEPAIEFSENREQIADELGLAAKATLDGDPEQARNHMARAGMIGQNAAKDWFYRSENQWPPNAPATIKKKGSDRPLIDTAAMRDAIVWVIAEKT
jgi:hypothetical protein